MRRLWWWLTLSVLWAAVVVCPVGLPAAAAATAWQWPVDPAHLLRAFDPPDGPYGPGHRGVDLATEAGQIVVSPADGDVSWTGVIGGVPVVVVTHGALRSTLQPVEAVVGRGQHVARGEPVGRVGAASFHCLVGCVHWGVRRGEDYVDPLSMLETSHARLLPYWDIPPPDSQYLDGTGDAQVSGARAGAEAGAGADARAGAAPTTVRATEPDFLRPRASAAARGAHVPRPLVTGALSLGVGGLLAWWAATLIRRRM